MTIKNEARFWSRKLGRKKKRKESKIFVRIFQFGQLGICTIKFSIQCENLRTRKKRCELLKYNREFTQRKSKIK